MAKTTNSLCDGRTIFQLTRDLGLSSALIIKKADRQFKKDMRACGYTTSMEKKEHSSLFDTVKKRKGSKTVSDLKEAIKEDFKEVEDVKVETTSAKNDFREVKEPEIEVLDPEPALLDPTPRATDLVVVTKEDGSKTIQRADDPNCRLIDDDTLTENLEVAHQNVRFDAHQTDLIIGSLLIMDEAITSEQLLKLCRSEDDCIVINTVSNFFGAVKIIPNCSALGINEVVPATVLDKIVTFENDYYCKEIRHMDEDDYSTVFGNMMNKCRDLVTVEAAQDEALAGSNNPDPIVPIKFINSNLVISPEKGSTLPKGTIKRLETAFGDLLNNRSYQFNNLGSLYELFIYNTGRMDSYVIDPGNIIGNGFGLMCNIPGDQIFVNLKHKDIIRKVLDNPNYILTVEETYLVLEDMFKNQKIYSWLDMSKGPEILPKMSKDDFRKLEKKLTFIEHISWNPITIAPFSRMRIRSFKSINDFVLVSDNKVKCQMPEFMLNNITPGLTIRVKDDDIVVENNELKQNYHIDNYDIL